MEVMLRAIVAIVIIGPAFAAGQLSGQFYLEKTTFAPGEPIFLYFQIVNEGPQPETILSAEPYTFCSGYHVTVSSDFTTAKSCSGVGSGGSCLSSTAVVLQGKKRIERLLLNYDHKVNMPGEYSVAASRNLPYSRSSVDYFRPEVPKNELEVQTTLYFRVDASAAADSQVILTLVHQLRSPDLFDRREAARTLASVAPPALEDVLLQFAGNSEFRQFAPLALYHLHTKQSMTALANLLVKSEIGSYENLESARYLSESGDLQWFPLLEDVARKHAQISNYVNYAADLGGEGMLPTLIMLTHSEDREFTRINAVTGMEYTGSRKAVPILIEFLRDPDPDIRSRARGGLQSLTHRATKSNLLENPQSEYAKWAQWWERNSATAPVYKEGECGDSVPLL
jgi:hypothetical protein